MLLDELHAGEDNHVEGLEALEEADLLVLYLRFRQWPEEDLAALQAYVDRGSAIAAFRTSTHAFATTATTSARTTTASARRSSGALDLPLRPRPRRR